MTEHITRKECRISMSKKYPDGSMVTITLGTEIEESCEDTAADQVLWERVFASVQADLQQKAKTDPIVASIAQGVTRQIKNEKKVAQALRETRGKADGSNN